MFFYFSISFSEQDKIKPKLDIPSVIGDESTEEEGQILNIQTEKERLRARH